MIVEVADQTVRSDGAGKSRSKRRKENRRNKRKGNEAAKNTSADNGAGNDYKKTSPKPSILSHSVSEPFRRGDRKGDIRLSGITVSNIEIIKTTRCLLNKTTPNNLDIIALQTADLPLSTVEDLCCIVDIIFEKAVAEPIYSATYAMLCQRIYKVLNVVTKSDPPHQKKFRVIFRQRYLAGFYDMVDVCRSAEPIHQSEKKRYKGICRFIGELYNVGLLSRCMIRDCISELFLCEREEGIECLCLLLTTVGKEFDRNSGKADMSRYMTHLSHRVTGESCDSDIGSSRSSCDNITEPTLTLSTRIRFMLIDLIQLRQADWTPRIALVKPKRIADLHADIEAERASSCRLFSAQAKIRTGTQFTGSINSRDNSRQ